MLQRCIAFLLFFSFLLNTRSQSARERFEQRKDVFLSNNIYVIYSGSAVLDSALKESFTKFWTIRPIKGFIAEKESRNLMPDEHNSFFHVSHYIWLVSQSSYAKRSTAGIFAFNGGKKNTGKYDLRFDAVSAEYFDYVCNEKEFDHVAYRLPLIVAGLQRDINLKYDTSGKAPFSHEKMLLINKEVMQGSARRAGIRKDAMGAWPWKHEVKPAEEIAQLIRSRDNRYLLLTPTLSDIGAIIELHDLESMKPVASVSRTAVMGLPWVRVKEIEKLVEAIRSGK
jgi:hypothetical protein